MKKFCTRMLGVCSLLIAFSFATTEASAQCAVIPPAGVDVGSACYSQVISADPFCCDTDWDSICQTAYDTCTGGPTSCAADPGCAADVNSAAYQTTIAQDPFCCNTFWDSICASAYAANGGLPNPDPACDSFCVNLNLFIGDPCTFAGQNGTVNASCECETDGTCAADPGCAADVNSAAYQTTIANDPFCCATFWDGICASAYAANGGLPNPDPACDSFCVNLNLFIGDECFTFEGLGTVSPDCECIVPVCVDPGCVANTNSSEYLQVIAADPFCCETEWDSLCQAAYDSLGGLPSNAPSCDPSQCIDPGCAADPNSAAYLTVIDNDTFCCFVAWDGLCASAYAAAGGLPNPDPDCGGTPVCAADPGCDADVNSPQYAQVIASDPFCCDTEWDFICQDAYNALGGQPNPDPACGGPVDCVADPGCDADVNSPQYAQVIAADPFCCNNTWDFICQDAYDALGGQPNPDPACSPCNVDGGTVSTSSPTTGLCKGDGVANIVQLSVSGNVGSGIFGLVTQGTLNVVATSPAGTFNMENFPAGQYLAGWVAVPNLSDLQGVTNVNQLSGCFDLSNAIFISSIQLTGGVVSTAGPTTICGGSVTVTVTGNQGPLQRYALLNQTATTVLAQNNTGVFNFNALAPGIYRIVSISYTSSVNLGSITPPTLPPCVVSSNLLTITKQACATATLGSSPNPTTATSWVTFSVPTEDYTTLEVYDMSGRKVADLFNQVTQSDMEYRLEFNGGGLPNGIYIYRLTTGSEVIIDKFMIAK